MNNHLNHKFIKINHKKMRKNNQKSQKIIKTIKNPVDKWGLRFINYYIVEYKYHNLSV